VIAMYLEDVKDGEKFKRVVSEISRKKPIVILKSGVTKEGSQAAISHTGGMVGDDQVYGTVFKQYGLIRVQELEEFLTLLKVFSYQKEPINKTVLVLSNAGGAGVLLTDKLIKEKLPLVTVSPKVKEMIVKSMKGKKITLHNPIDLLGDASAFDYERIISVMLHEKDIGAIILLLTPQANTEITKTAEIVVEMQKRFSLPIYPIFMGKKSMFGVGKLFEKNRIAGFANFDHLPIVLAKINWWKENFKGSGMDDVLTKLDSFNHENI
jgi:acetate---CoA ligase (ADP-forming)